ncbi:hypothetical protein K8P10_002983 [Leucobacter sp. Psy1]|nr:hypothetical protein K8P10_002983 [Leucobacter sp. Psy1]
MPNIEVIRRFVEQQLARFLSESPSDMRTLALPARQRSPESVCSVLELDTFKRSVHCAFVAL